MNKYPHQIYLIKKVSKELHGKYDCNILSDELDYNILTPLCKVIIVTKDEIIKRYPTLITDVPKQKKKKYSTMYLYNTEQFILWYEKSIIKYKYIWLFETDVGFSGNINTLLDYYSNDNSDLIAQNLEIMSNDWLFSKTGSKKYMEYLEQHIGNNISYVSWAYVQRYSNNLMSFFKKYTNQEYHRHAEAFPAEITKIERLKYNLLDKRFIGKPLSWGGKVTKKQWINITQDPSKQNKLYHALKF